ncbi:hypothetical protein BGZ54_009279 [Gamsiella multidivaricata]|nr:hypothetical protein BGZ54_009279 [Gamsiella multidivaricata]
MLCPTIRTIKKALQRLRGYPSGYGPLVLDTSMSLTEASWTYFSLGQEQPHGHDQDQNQEKQGPCTCLERALSSNASVQPRPRTILLASLGMWTVLIALSSLLGFNTIGTSPVIVSRTPPQNNRSDGLARIVLEHGPSNIDLQSWASTSWDKEPNHCSQKNVRQGESVVTDNVKDEDEDKEDVDDFLDPDSLDAMTMDPEDFVVFRNFLVALEAENLIAKPKDEKQHQDILKATNDLMIDSMLEQDLPCGYRTSPLFTPTWFVGFPAVVQKFRNSINSDHLTTVPHTSGRVFEYLAGWTEVMILAVTMTLGSLLVGLMQSKTLYYQLLEQHELHQQQLFVFETPVRRRSSWTTLALCFALSGSALCLMIDMILAECWDVPSVYFVGIGIAGMILVHAWVPNLPLQVSESMESTDSDDGEEDGEGDEEKGKWGTSMSEHRNACSLDEDRRYGV